MDQYNQVLLLSNNRRGGRDKVRWPVDSSVELKGPVPQRRKESPVFIKVCWSDIQVCERKQSNTDETRWSGTLALYNQTPTNKAISPLGIKALSKRDVYQFDFVFLPLRCKMRNASVPCWTELETEGTDGLKAGRRGKSEQLSCVTKNIQHCSGQPGNPRLQIQKRNNPTAVQGTCARTHIHAQTQACQNTPTRD